MRLAAASLYFRVIISASGSRATTKLKLRDLVSGFSFALIASVGVADDEGPYIMSVADVRDLRPGPEWNPNVDNLLVEVRGYLRDVIGMDLYATKDQAQLGDISGVAVSDEGEGELRARCSEGFVELTAIVGWMEKERRPILIPLSAKRLILKERGWPDREVCWQAE